MNAFTRTDLNALIGDHRGPCVSIYLRTVPAGPEKQQNPIRLKNLLRATEERLRRRGIDDDRIEELLLPLWRLVAPGQVWLTRSVGFVAFTAPGFFRSYELPIELQDEAYVNDCFYVAPLSSMLATDRHFYLLALSANSARFFRGTRFDLSRLDVPGMPAGLDDVLRLIDAERELQAHSARGRQTSEAQGRSMIYHGHGGKEDDMKERLREYFRLIDRALHDVLRKEQAPLLLAGVDYLFPLYAEVNTYAHLHHRGIPGNSDGLADHDLHRLAWPVVERYFNDELREHLDAYHRLEGTGRTSTRVDEILPAAEQGRVAVLFTRLGVHQWGTVDAVGNGVHAHAEQTEGSRELINLLAVTSWRNGGTVVPLSSEDLPRDTAVAAMFRY